MTRTLEERAADFMEWVESRFQHDATYAEVYGKSIAHGVSDSSFQFGRYSRGVETMQDMKIELGTLLEDQQARIEELEEEQASHDETMKDFQEVIVRIHDSYLGLKKAAKAVIDRWNTPLWKDVEATAVCINTLAFVASLGEPRTENPTVAQETGVADAGFTDKQVEAAANVLLERMKWIDTN